MTRSRRIPAVLAAAGLVAALAPAAAPAATTIGSTAAVATQNTTRCADGSACLLLTDDAVVAASGVITGWHLRSASVGGSVRLRVLRPAGGGRFTGAGTGAPQTITRGDPYVNDYPERLPVRAGDVLALDGSSSALVLSEGAGTVGVIAGTPLADGATAAEPGARRVLLDPAQATTTIPTLAAGATTTFHLSVGPAASGPAYPELTSTVRATADQGDPQPASNAMTRTFNLGPTLSKPTIDFTDKLVAGREDLLRQVRVVFTEPEPEPVRVTMTLTNRSTGRVTSHLLDAPAGYGVVGGLFRAGGPFAHAPAGSYLLRVRARDPGLLESPARRIQLRIRATS
jgi:hypothetical protein